MKETLRASSREQYSRHTITKLNFLRPDDYNRAVDDQLGVIGNDFWGAQKLLTNFNPNNDVSYDLGTFDTPTDYLAVTGFKTTLCGKAYSQEFSDGDIDDDLNLEIVCYPKDPVFQTTFSKIKNRSYSIYPWPMVEGEIDITKNYHKYFDPNTPGLSFPTRFKTDVCLYGPWIEEVYQPSEDKNPFRDHVDNHEIHPSEQFWWTEKTQTGFRYYLNSANDASGRFTQTGWASDALRNTFAIAFDIHKPGKIKNKIIYNIIIRSDQNVSPLMADAEKHYLILGADTLIEVNESHGKNILSVSFESVGVDPFSVSSGSDTLIKGFVVIQTTLENIGDNYGNLKLTIDKKVTTNIKPQVATLIPGIKIIPKNEQTRPDAIQAALRPRSVKVTLKEITTLENKLRVITYNQYNAFIPQFSYVGFKLTGYIFAEKESNHSSFSRSSSQILEEKPQLLFPLSPDPVESNNRVIYHNHEKKTSNYNNSIILTLGQGEGINILTDFVASYESSSYKRTLELINDSPYHELKVKLSDLKKGQPVLKEIMLHNWERDPNADPKEYKMKIVIEFFLLD